jgi:hypothetical protein
LKSSFGNVKVKHTKYDTLVYGCIRKPYTRSKPIKSGWTKIKNNPRENVAIIKLTRLGYTINQISIVLGRSFSYIHKRVRTAITRGILRFIDKRKLPGNIRTYTSGFRLRNIIKWIKAWEAYILGETDRPP